MSGGLMDGIFFHTTGPDLMIAQFRNQFYSLSVFQKKWVTMVKEGKKKKKPHNYLTFCYISWHIIFLERERKENRFKLQNGFFFFTCLFFYVGSFSWTETSKSFLTSTMESLSILATSEISNRKGLCKNENNCTVSWVLFFLLNWWKACFIIFSTTISNR